MKHVSHSKSLNHRKWMVVYTRSKWEKKVVQLLEAQHIGCFCPLIKSKRKWADRYSIVETPLFNSYVFVYVNLHEQLRVLQTAGVVCFVTYNHAPAVIPLADIDRVRKAISEYAEVETLALRSLQIGDSIAIKEGALTDAQGEVVEVHGKTLLVVLKPLDCALLAKVKVNTAQVALLKQQKVALASQ